MPPPAWRPVGVQFMNSQPGAGGVVPSIHFAGNRLLATLSPPDRALLESSAEIVSSTRALCSSSPGTIFRMFIFRRPAR
jgi:hypothetical protein